MNANPEVLAGTSGLLDIEKTKNATHRYPALSDSSTEFHQPNEPSGAAQSPDAIHWIPVCRLRSVAERSSGVQDGIACGKAFTRFSLNRDAAILISLTLQHGAEFERISRTLARGVHEEPQSLMGAVVDRVVREIELETTAQDNGMREGGK